MDYLSQPKLKAMVIACLFASAQTDRPGRQASELAKYFKNPVGERRVLLAIETLESEGIVEDIGQSSWIYALTDRGYETAEKSYLSEKVSRFRTVVDKLVDYFLKGEDATASVSGNEGAEIPAADRIVQIGHNTAGYEEAVDGVSNAIASVRGSNVIDPAERAWILPNLQVGLDALKKGGSLLVSGLKTFLLEPLRAALKSISEEKLKSAISVAIAAVKNLIGM